MFERSSDSDTDSTVSIGEEADRHIEAPFAEYNGLLGRLVSTHLISAGHLVQCLHLGLGLGLVSAGLGAGHGDSRQCLSLQAVPGRCYATAFPGCRCFRCRLHAQVLQVLWPRLVAEDSTTNCKPVTAAGCTSLHHDVQHLLTICIVACSCGTPRCSTR